MMGEEISPSLAAVSPPRRWPRPARTGSLVRQSPSTIGTDRVSRRSRFQEVDPQWGTDSSTRPRPPTQVSPRDKSKVQQRPRQWPNIRACSQPRQSVLPPSARHASQKSTDHDAARPGDVVHYLCTSRQAVAPGEGGVLQLRVARKLCNYVSSSQELLSMARHGQCHSHCNKTVRLFRVASMS